MTATRYNAKRKGNNRPTGSIGAQDLVTIPNAHALSETDKGLRCDFGDEVAHWVAKSHIAPESEVKRSGDRGRLVITKWLAQTARLMKFTVPTSPWRQFPRFRHRLQELNAALGPDDPARPIIKTL